MNEYKLISTERIFGKIEDQLSSLSATVMDVGQFYSEVKWCISRFGLAAYDLADALIYVDNYKGDAPCDFYLLDSAWLCGRTPIYNQTIPQPQSRFVVYNREITEIISQNTSCNGISPAYGNVNPMMNGVVIESNVCNNNNEQVLEKISTIDYIQGEMPIRREWHNPQLLTVRTNKSVKNVFAKDCKNIGVSSPNEISIEQQGQFYYIHSTLPNPVIYLRYYRFPTDIDTGLPLIPDVPIIERGIEYHLMHYFFYMAWLNGNIDNIERKVKDLEEKRNQYMMEAENYCKQPSFQKTVELMRRQRRKWAAYEIIGDNIGGWNNNRGDRRW